MYGCYNHGLHTRVCTLWFSWLIGRKPMHLQTLAKNFDVGFFCNEIFQRFHGDNLHWSLHIRTNFVDLDSFQSHRGIWKMKLQIMCPGQVLISHFQNLYDCMCRDKIMNIMHLVMALSLLLFFFFFFSNRTFWCISSLAKNEQQHFFYCCLSRKNPFDVLYN